MKKTLIILIFLLFYGTTYPCYCQESEIDANDKIKNAIRDKLQQPDKVLDVICVKEGWYDLYYRAH